MNINRLTDKIELNRGDSFIIFYNNVNDDFIDEDLVIGNIDFMLWRFFKQEGYKRIAFFSGADKIFFYDKTSKDLCIPSQAQTSQSSISVNSTDRLNGPMGRVNLLRRQRSNPQDTRQNETIRNNTQGSNQQIRTNRRRMTDLNALEILNYILCEDKSNTPTVIIFSPAEYISPASFEGYTEIQNRMIKWGQKITEKKNLCVFIFQTPTLEEISTFLKSIQLTVLYNHLYQKETKGDSSNLIRVGSPDKTEVERLVDRRRLNYNMTDFKIDWQNLDKLTSSVSGQDFSLKELWSEMQGLTEFTKETVRKYIIKNGELQDKSASEILQDLIGLKTVKDKIKEISASVEVLGKTGTLHMAFLGNPGTGKTTVAGLVGEIFRDLGILKKGHTIVAENRGAMVGEYEGHSAMKVNELINRAIDGILFIDEAHALVRDEGDDPFGEEAVKTLVARMERERERLCVILAGYTTPLRKLITTDPGLKSRIKYEVIFEDYTPEELKEIFKLMVRGGVAKGMPDASEETVNAVGDVFKGMYETRDKEDWGNAREVRNFYEKMLTQYALRVSGQKDRDKLLLIEDIPEEYRIYLRAEFDVDELLKEVNNLIGLNPVKEFINQLVDTVRHEQTLQDRGISKGKDRPMRHMLFIGNPGTGKTTVAKLMGRILKGLGILNKGHVVETNGGELCGSHVGEGIEKTGEKIREALGGILFIDEIYGLTSGSLGDTYGSDVITKLITAMTNHKENLIIIGAGYPNKIKDFLGVNDGLNRRFTGQIVFPDFDVNELKEILIRQLRLLELKVSPEVEKAIESGIKTLYKSKGEGFGNAGLMEKIARKIKTNLATRVNKIENPTNDELITILEADLHCEEFPLRDVKDAEDIDKIVEEINKMVGLRKVKEFINKQVAFLKMREKRQEMGIKDKDGDRSLHMVFTGSPGTGKTTIARYMGQLFKALGILTKGHLKEVDQSDMIAGYVGQTQEKTREVIQEALDGVLFIDEAYSLTSHGDYGKQAIDQLVKMMEDYRSRLVVIVAGYTDAMRRFIESNEGLKSRFTQYIEFEDYTAEELQSIFMSFCNNSPFRLSSDALKHLKEYISSILSQKKKDFGNAREMRQLFQMVIENQSLRVSKISDPSEEQLITIIADDFPSIPHLRNPNQSSRRSLKRKELPLNEHESARNLDRIRAVKQSVGYVDIECSDGSKGNGTGFVITSNGKFVTSYHVVENAKEIKVRFGDNLDDTVVSALLLNGDKDADIAILQLASTDIPYVLIANESEQVNIGEKVGLLGYPHGESLGCSVTYTEGVVSSIRSTPEGTLIQIDVNAYPGNSGGPLFRLSDGVVLGVLKGGLENSPSLNFAVSIQELHNRLIINE